MDISTLKILSCTPSCLTCRGIEGTARLPFYSSRNLDRSSTSQPGSAWLCLGFHLRHFVFRWPPPLFAPLQHDQRDGEFPARSGDPSSLGLRRGFLGRSASLFPRRLLACTSLDVADPILLGGIYALHFQQSWFATLKASYLLGISIPFAWYASQRLAFWVARAGALRFVVTLWLATLGIAVTLTFTTGLIFEKIDGPGLPWQTTLETP